MSLRAKVYYHLWRNRKFGKWSRFYQEILEGGSKGSEKYLVNLLDHSINHVPYYKEAFAGKSLTSLVENFSDLPILKKSDVVKSFSQLKSDDIDSRDWTEQSTGGSTGAPLTILQDKDFLEWGMATSHFFHQNVMGFDFAAIEKIILWSSVRDLNPKAKFQKLVGDWLRKTCYLNSFELSPKIIAEYIGIINSRKPEFIRGFAGSLFLLAKYAKENNLKIHSPKYLCSSAETLRPFMRQMIEEMFGAKVHDFYGTREVGPVAAECSSGKMHTFPFNNLIEVVDENNKHVEPGQEGKILITTLHNHVMPLIRYEIGDMAVWGGSCDCGNDTPVMDKVTGRITDHFLTKSGTLVHGQFFTRLFYFKDWISEFQILQKEVDEIEVFYLRRGEVNQKDISGINEKVIEIMEGECNIKWTEVDQIPKTPQGKWLFTRSLVASRAEGKLPEESFSAASR